MIFFIYHQPDNGCWHGYGCPAVRGTTPPLFLSVGSIKRHVFGCPVSVTVIYKIWLRCIYPTWPTHSSSIANNCQAVVYKRWYIRLWLVSMYTETTTEQPWASEMEYIPPKPNDIYHLSKISCTTIAEQALISRQPKTCLFIDSNTTLKKSGGGW